MHQCLSLSLYICKHGLDPDHTRMVFRIECFVNLKMCVHKTLILWNVRLCRTKADAHDKFGFWVLIASSCNKIDWLTQTLCFDILRNQAKTKDSSANTVQSLSTFTTCYQKIVRRAWSANKHTESPTLRPMITEHFRQVPPFRCMPLADPEGVQGVRTPPPPPPRKITKI